MKLLAVSYLPEIINYLLNSFFCFPTFNSSITVGYKSAIIALGVSFPEEDS